MTMMHSFLNDALSVLGRQSVILRYPNVKAAYISARGYVFSRNRTTHMNKCRMERGMAQRRRRLKRSDRLCTDAAGVNGPLFFECRAAPQKHEPVNDTDKQSAADYIPDPDR